MQIKRHIPSFTNGIVDDYFNARTPILCPQTLSRGTARSVSALAEERFASLLVSAYPQIQHIYIDQELRTLNHPVIKPDLVVMCGDEIRLLVDVKMDLGRIRDKLPLLASTGEHWLHSIHGEGREVRLNARVSETTRERRTVPVASNCRYLILVISGMNTSVDRLNWSMTSRDASSPQNVERFEQRIVLWPGSHPNHPRYSSRPEAVTHLLQNISLEALKALEAVCAFAFIRAAPSHAPAKITGSTGLNNPRRSSVQS